MDLLRNEEGKAIMDITIGLIVGWGLGYVIGSWVTYNLWGRR